MTAILFLLPLGLIFDQFGYLPPSVRLAAVFGLLALPLCLRSSREAGWVGAGLAAAALARVWLAPQPVVELALLLLMHQAVWAAVGTVPRAVRTGVLAYAAVHVVLFLSPIGHPGTELLARAGNAVAGFLTGNTFHFGPTYQGLGGLLLFMTLSVWAWDGAKTAVARSVALFPLLLLANTLGAVVLLEKAYLVNQEGITAVFTWSLKFQDPFGFPEIADKLRLMAVIFYPKILFVLQLAVYLALHGFRWRKPASDAEATGLAALREEVRPGRTRWITAGAVALLVLAVTPPTSVRRPAARELVFVEKGVVSFTKPDYERYGEAAGGMFGMLPEYAALYGCKSTVVRDIPGDPGPGQILVLTNLDVDIGADARRKLWEFVEKGGGLWVLGDHTFIKNGRNHLNELLEKVHISFNNDSAQFFPQGWFNSYQFLQGTPFAGLTDEAENRPGILVGASLELGAPAQPFVRGRFGFSDRGLERPEGDRGYLGDFKYQRAERLGDLVLVAGERYGRGRVLVFGDTSSFFNNNLTRSHELLRASLSWLGEPDIWLLPASAGWRVAAILLAIGLLVYLFVRRADAPAAAGLAAMGLTSLIGHGGGQLGYDTAFARKHLAIIDYSHQPNASKHSATDGGLHGVGINLMRHGELPVAMNRWDSGLLEQARYVVLNAPRVPFGTFERRTLTKLMERGGTVILGCGHLDAAGSDGLLEPLGCRIGSTPLGRFFDLQAFGRPVSFMSAWALEKVPPNARIICTSPDWPLIVAIPVGKGELVVIADSEFLHNRNVEGHKNHDPANTAFLKNLLDSLAR